MRQKYQIVGMSKYVYVTSPVYWLTAVEIDYNIETMNVVNPYSLMAVEFQILISDTKQRIVLINLIYNCQEPVRQIPQIDLKR